MQSLEGNAEDYGKKVLNRLGKDTFSYIPAILIPAFINVLSLMIFTRIFAPKEYGEYSLIISTTGIVSALLSQWINQSIQRFRPEYRESQNVPSFNYFLNILLVVTMLFFLMFSFITYPIIDKWLNQYKEYYFLGIGLIITQSLFTVGSTLYQADLKVKEFRLYQVVNSLLKLSLGLSGVYLINKDIYILIWGTMLSFLVLIIPMFKDTKLLSKSSVKNVGTEETFKLFLSKFSSYGFPMMGWFLGTSILNLSDRYMLEYFKTGKEVGIYSANFSIVASSLGLICSPLISAAHPVIMRAAADLKEDSQKLESIIFNFSRIFLLVTFPIISFVIVYRNEMASILLGKEFWEGAIIIPFLLIGFFAWNFAMYGHKGHEILKKTKTMFFYVIVSAVVNVILNLYLIPKYSYLGASIGTMIGFFVYPALIYISSGNYIKWRLSGRLLGKLIFISLVLMLTFHFLNIFMEKTVNPLINLVISSILFFPLYIGFLGVTNELKIRDLINRLPIRRK